MSAGKFKVGDHVRIIDTTSVAQSSSNTGVIHSLDHGFNGIEKYYRIKLDKPFVNDIFPNGLRAVGRSEYELELIPL